MRSELFFVVTPVRSTDRSKPLHRLIRNRDINTVWIVPPTRAVQQVPQQKKRWLLDAVEIRISLNVGMLNMKCMEYIMYSH